MGRIAFSDMFCMAFICGWSSGVVSALSITLWMLSGLADMGVLSGIGVGLKGFAFLLILLCFSAVFYQAIWLPFFFVIGKVMNCKAINNAYLLFLAAVIYGVTLPYYISIVLINVTIVGISSFIVSGLFSAILAACLLSYVQKYRLAISAESESGGKIFFYPRWASRKVRSQ
jgi:hypothetical protein